MKATITFKVIHIRAMAAVARCVAMYVLEIHQEKMVGLSLTEFSLVRSEWGAGGESVSV